MNIRKLIIILVHDLVGWALWVVVMLIYGTGTNSRLSGISAYPQKRG